MANSRKQSIMRNELIFTRQAISRRIRMYYNLESTKNSMHKFSIVFNQEPLIFFLGKNSQ